MRVREYGMLFALALIWGASFLFIKLGVDAFSSSIVVAGRLLASVLLLGIVIAFNRSLIAGWRRYGWLGVVVGFVNNFIPFSLIAWGETRITSGTASILNATTPLFTVLLAGIWVGKAHEALTLKRFGGVVLGFIGVAVLVGPSALDVFSGHAGDVWGELAVMGGALFYGIGTLLSRGFAGASRLVAPVTTQVSALVLALLATALWGLPAAVPDFSDPAVIKAIVAIVILGAVGTGLAYLIYFWLVNNVGATRTAIVTYLLPFTALIWGAIFLGEPIQWYALAGLVLILVGTMVTNGTIRFSRGRYLSAAVEAEASGGAITGIVAEESAD